MASFGHAQCAIACSLCPPTGADETGAAVDRTPLIPQATSGYPVDHRLRAAARAERGARPRFVRVRALVVRLRRGAAPAAS